MHNTPDSFRQRPDDGHALLLMETQPDEETFSDYPDLNTCLDKMLEVYEKTLESAGRNAHNYDLEDVSRWLSTFRRIEVFIFDQEISRYKRIRRVEFKDLFISQMKKSACSSQDSSLDNGF